MKQTAVEWVFEQIKLSSKKTDNINNDHLFFYRMLEQAKQMEKQQIVDAYGQGTADEAGEILDVTKDAEQYYNETHGK